MYKEKSLDAIPGYAIFFDNVRVDKYVTNFNVNLYSNGSMGSASIGMIYAKDLYKVHTKNSQGEVTSVEDGIEDGTNVKIFVRNIFNGKYVSVFDGMIKGRSLQKSTSGTIVNYSATDYMLWLNKTVVPVVAPVFTETEKGEALKWKAQGIDIRNVPKIMPSGEYSFRGKTLEEFIGKMRGIVLTLNKIFSSADSVSYWDNADGRISIMGDISPNLISRRIIDFVITSSATAVHSLYVGINDIAQKLMFEFFQDRDGVIRIKPPFWNQKVLRDHVIDPIMIVSQNNLTSWSKRVTRLSVTGGIEEYQESLSDFMKSVVTPAGAYVGGNKLWSDFLSDTTGKSSVSVAGNVSNGNLGGYLQGVRISGEYLENRSTHYHQGVDYALSHGTPLYNIGLSGTAYKKSNPNGYGTYVIVVIEEGDFKDFSIIYGHMSSSPISSSGTKVSAGQYIGDVGSTGRSSGPHLHLEVRATSKYKSMDSRATKNTMDPEYYIKLLNGENIVIETHGNDSLLEPSEEEKRYGMSIQDVFQPLIKFTGKGDSDRDTHGRDALKKYAEFRYDLANSMIETSNVNLIGMPWLRPGFNVWLDPLVVDTVYYINSVSHSGSPDTGVFTSLGLTLGRNRINFANGTSDFGAMKSESDNAFISKMNQTVSDFGSVINNSAGFHAIRKSCEKFYSSEDNYTEKSVSVQYLKNLYGVTNADRKIKTVGDVDIKPISESIEDELKFNYDKMIGLKPDDTSIYVRDLRAALELQGYEKLKFLVLSVSNEVDDENIFDFSLKQSLMSYQSSKGLKKTGIADEKTVRKLKQDEINDILNAKKTVRVEGGKNLSGVLFTGEYTLGGIQSLLNASYSNAPSVVKKRANRLKRLVDSVSSYLRKRYITDNF